MNIVLDFFTRMFLGQSLVSVGERNNINLGDCMGRDTLSSNVEKCDFNYVDGDNNGTKWNKCRLHAEEGYAYNIYTCKSQSGGVALFGWNKI